MGFIIEEKREVLNPPPQSVIVLTKFKNMLIYHTIIYCEIFLK